MCGVKAAAYWFYVCRNYPFVDGNKSVAVVLICVSFFSASPSRSTMDRIVFPVSACVSSTRV